MLPKNYNIRLGFTFLVGGALVVALLPSADASMVQVIELQMGNACGVLDVQLLAAKVRSEDSKLKPLGAEFFFFWPFSERTKKVCIKCVCVCVFFSVCCFFFFFEDFFEVVKKGGNKPIDLANDEKTCLLPPLAPPQEPVEPSGA